MTADEEWSKATSTQAELAAYVGRELKRDAGISESLAI